MVRDEQRRDTAAIASERAGTLFGLEALRTGIQDYDDNITRFLAISRQRVPLGTPDKTSLVFTLKSAPGALFKALSVFALRDIDLSKLESRPVPGRPWEYLFYLDVAAAREDLQCARAMVHLAEFAAVAADARIVSAMARTETESRPQQRRAATGRSAAWLTTRNPQPLKWQSGGITDGPSRAPARAMLHAAGFTGADLARPVVGVANTWIEIGPCNFHLRDLAVSVKAGIRAAGGTPMEFNTVSISDGITMGSAGMRTSLVSREVIADSIELVTRGNLFDALVVLVGCDKTIPGAAMALARLDIPGLILYGGSIAPGRFAGRDVTIQDVFEAVGAHAAGRMSDADLCEIEDKACPGAGACGGQFTANTMATACEFLGLAPMGSGDVPAVDGDKEAVAETSRRARDGRAQARACARRSIVTRESLENAIAAVAATGGSTNAVLHLMAIAREAGVTLALEDFDRDQRARAAPGGSEARRTVRRGRSAPRRRHAPRRQPAAARPARCTPTRSP